MHRKRCFVHDMGDDVLPDIGSLMSKQSSALQQSLAVLQQGLRQGTGFSGPTVYVGLAGIALNYFRLYECCRRVKSTQAESGWAGTDPSEQAQLYLKSAFTVINAAGTSQRLTFHEGQPGIYAVKAAILHAQGEGAQALAQAQKLQELGPAVLQMPPGECELLYGRSGYLYALLFTRKYLGASSISAELVKTIVQQIVTEGSREAARVNYNNMPLLWQWHGKYYLGAAHGVTGILHTLLLACDVFDPRELFPGLDLLELIRQTTKVLAHEAMKSGNLPSSLGTDDDRLVHWCHGATGFLPLVAKLQEQDSNDLFAQASRTSADVIWTRGLLTKGVGLCHGISGNAYALLSAYRYTGDDRYLRRALQFGSFMADHWQELLNIPDRPLSLYEVCLVPLLLHIPELAQAMPTNP
ncbi:LanC-like protein 2 [Coccomyxa sp. Obi]|nr:LanC-like protein 2 [Coccomyxa sp. Obi]